MFHINALELRATKLALLTFSKQKYLKAVHFEIDNTTALLYLVKPRNREPNITLSKELRQYLLKRQITITEE